jgi:pimeloyl-ACP methyl ester carboxylesterase
LASPVLGQVRAPTLLIVGGRDAMVLDLNREAQKLIGGESHMTVVPHATHLFEEPGALEEVANLAGEWFLRYLARVARPL